MTVGPLVLGVAPHCHTFGFEPLLVVVEVGRVGHLEAKVVQPVGGLQGQDQRVVLVLIPTLEEHSVGFAGGLNQAHHLGVVRRREFQVGHAQLHMRQAQNAHRSTPSA
ncbi:MAG: hypothetical protein V9E81_16765 [Marmoricola sp.]